MLKQIDLKKLAFNPFSLIGEEWLLIGAGDEQKVNMMTASWGTLGILWGKPVATVVIRPQRYTLELVDQQEYFTLNFFANDKKAVLNYCGAHSGRDVDKVKVTGLTPVFDVEAPYFAEAKLVFICKKLYKSVLKPAEFIDQTIDATWYKEQDYHEVFTGEIIKVLSE
ncbi:MAG TPA: flavin reductase family protein [Candidatus Avacidaminococcus intestinavium]|uniref:Flavin reductase family protein n=1 Tax=Candidatus Avacidaminococcus intestinavium TaxID=2840684 RepID=A0A9D1MRH9_9FIRM|nr:flavin reductase family protein [Candidatus Avacidaminococcus intestinavium]